MKPEGDALRRLQEEGREKQRQRVARMTPIERMEEAYRLFLLARGKA